MKTRDLLRELLHRSNLKASGLAEKLVDQGVSQPQLSRFLSHKTQEPKRSTLLPVADFFGVSVDAFFNEDMAESLLKQIESGEFVVKRRRAAGTVTEFPMLTNPMQLTDALDMLADRINAIEDIAHRELIARRLQSMAVSPDSMKARNAVLEALTWANAVSVDQAQQANQIPGIAGRVLEQKLTTESKAFHPETLKT